MASKIDGKNTSKYYYVSHLYRKTPGTDNIPVEVYKIGSSALEIEYLIS
jgi:hypothetical protein